MTPAKIVSFNSRITKLDKGQMSEIMERRNCGEKLMTIAIDYQVGEEYLSFAIKRAEKFGFEAFDRESFKGRRLA